MRILLIRHGETVDNVAGNLAGVTDSALTVHGLLQTRRLGSHLAAKHGHFTTIFCSDLQRAKQTAQAILDACKQSASLKLSASSDVSEHLTVLEILREQDFGSLEGKPWSSSNRETTKRVERPDYVPPETKACMDRRCDTFIGDFVVPLLIAEPDCKVAVVSHGLLLSRLWKHILARSSTNNIQRASEVTVGARGLEHTGAWSNTGYMDLNISVTVKQDESTNGRKFTSDSGSVHLKGEKAGHIPASDSSSAQLGTTGASKSSMVNDVQDGTECDLPDESTHQNQGGEMMDESWPSFTLVINAVNSTAHLASLKRTRGGIGSAAHDASQKTLDGFFKRQKGGG